MNISQLIVPWLGFVLIGALSVFFLGIFIAIFIDMHKPEIQNRSPTLMLMIIIGILFDSTFKIYILMLNYTDIDTKCQLGLISRVVFHYVAFMFILIRIKRVHNVNKIEDELYDATILEVQEDDGTNQRGNGTNNKKKNKIIQEKLEQARMQREERVITKACVNWVVPLAIIGLITNFIPYMMVITPVNEQDVCWFYFLTRSPY